MTSIITGYTRGTEGHQSVTIGAELNNNVSFTFYPRRQGEWCVSHPNVAVVVNMESVWDSKYTSSETSDHLAIRVKFQHHGKIRLGAATYRVSRTN